MKKLVINLLFLSALIGVTVLLAKHASQQNVSDKRLHVAASFYPLYFFAQQIGGEKAVVSDITPAGAEPHDYEPSAGDIGNIEQSKLLILNGGKLEPWGDNVRQNLNPSKTAVVIAGEGLTTQQINENGQTAIDPHVWLSPPLAEQMADKIEQGFAKVDPANASFYQANANALKQKLQALGGAYAQGLSSCTQKTIITSHAAFGYLASTYHLRQISVAGLSPDAEPSQKQLQGLATFAKQNSVKYIFFESLASPKLSQTLAEAVGAQTLVLDPIEGLTQQDVATGKNYLTEMQQNLTNLELALQCHA